MNPSLPSPEFLDRMAAAFATLGRLHLQSPDQETLDQLAKLLDEWPIEDEGDTAFGLKELRASLAEKEEVAQIRRDHNLLYGVTAGAKVPPYESVHRNRDGLIFEGFPHQRSGFDNRRFPLLRDRCRIHGAAHHGVGSRNA